ncbi:response regulator transcription factor [Dehalococcoides mccartyi]|uniref:response regulator transcription factor n=1 Tax=Dehalococcoides mccartyi TaxID=61435 RepID=UPI001650D86D|nr:response regulator transcription factor [Dehalococcoides mccartyi]
MIIEDSLEVIDAITLALELRWPSVKISSTVKGLTGLDLVEREKFDLIILDLNLPDASGYEIIKQLRLFSRIPVIILSVRQDEKDIVKGLEYGADDYIVKPFSQLELLARVQAVLRRQIDDNRERIITVGGYTLEIDEATLIHENRRYHLSSSEVTILALLMSRAGHTIHHDTLAEELWGENYNVYEKNLKTHIRRLRSKLEVDTTQPKLIMTKPGIGYYWGSLNNP